MKRNANTATVAATAATATASTQNTTERKSAERSTHMKRNTVTVAAIDTAWKFTPASIALNGHVFTADKYAIAEKGDVYVLAKVEGVAVRIHVGKASPVYHEALEAAAAFAAQPKAEKPAEPKPEAAAEPAKPVEAKAAEPAKQAKPATKRKAPAKAAKQPEAAAEPAKPVEAKAAKPAKQAKPAKPAKQAKPAAEPAKPVAKAAAKPAEPAKPVVPADNAWIGTAIEGKGWRIAFDEATQRTRVIFAADPSAKQKAAIDAAGFFWSNTTKSWNKKLTRKAYRAAVALSETLNAIA